MADGPKKNSVTIKTPDMGLMTVTRRPDGVVIRHEASGQEQTRRMHFDEAVAHVKGGGPDPGSVSHA